MAREKERGKNTECELSGEKSTAQKHTLIIFLLCAAHLNLFQLLHTLKSFAVLSFPVCENFPTQSILIFAVYSTEVLFFFASKWKRKKITRTQTSTFNIVGGCRNSTLYQNISAQFAQNQRFPAGVSAV